ncbi:MAG TPA: hypothetical protein PKA02_00205 [Candidatus Saccharibacteria bacterium]|nr:hypothetical protein [Candidatus Saccharibacteria bacterium]
MAKIRLTFVCSIVIALVGFMAVPLLQPMIAGAASSSGFQSGRIMDDGIFFTSGTMSMSDIQTFLNSKVPACNTNHASTGSPNDSGPPYTCLKDYRQDVPARSADAYCGGSIGASGNVSSAQILYEVSRACNVNVKVLLVMLQKEQSLITDDWPWSIQYRSAMGYGCPDTAPCDAEYYGFFNQVYNAARQFQRYIKQSGSFNYRVGRTSAIPYQANRPDCGSSSVTIQTQATAALYNYTPYQPNVAALNNLYGTGDECSAYGNRNFWRLFNDWFGPTTSDSDANTLGFVRLNHSSGQSEYVGASSISSYAAISRTNLVGYPAVAPDGAVVPRFNPNGDLSYIRLNHSSGRVEVATFSAASGFQQLIDYRLVGYPAVAPDGAVVPMFWPNGDLVLIRLNHASGRTELVSLSASSGFQQVVNYRLVGYPAVAPDGAVVPMFNPIGDLSFVRLNHSSGRTEIATISAASGFQQLIDYRLTAYPSVTDFPAVKTLISR